MGVRVFAEPACIGQSLCPTAGTWVTVRAKLVQPWALTLDFT